MADRSDDGVRGDGFLSRWARRKQDVLAGKPVTEPDQPAPQPAVAKTVPASLEDLEGKTAVAQQNIAQAAPESVANQVPSAAPEEQLPAPTLQDAQALTPQSDFKPFMAHDVSPEVKNAAMKKLFADPHYNVMDMMDVYVDDYSKPDPIPESMLKELVSAKFLRLFERDEEEVATQHPVGEDADTVVAPTMAKLNTDAETSADIADAATPKPQRDPLLRPYDHSDL
jgi:Protein of unknown function (DUF3306)